MDIVADSGSVPDLQLAIDTVNSAGGGNVYVPSGKHIFNLYESTIPAGGGGVLTGIKVYGGVNVFGAGLNQTILNCPTGGWRSGEGSAYGDRLIMLDGANGKRIRISGIGLLGSVNWAAPAAGAGEKSNLVGLVEHGVTDFRVDHCGFTDFTNAAMGLESRFELPSIGNCGVVDHCAFDNPYKDIHYTTLGVFPIWGYGAIVNGAGWWNSTWRDISALFGKYGPEIIYFEDNTFRRSRHCIAAAGQGSDAYYCARHNYFTDNVNEYLCSFNDIHPGARGFEIYENTYVDVPCDYRSSADQGYWGRYFNRGIYPGGGAGLIHHNSIVNCALGVGLNNQGISADETWKINGWWIWGNTFNNVATHFSAPGNDPYPIRENIEYSLQTPTLAGNTYSLPPLPITSNLPFLYTPYPYPHPLTLEGQGVIAINSTIPNANFNIAKL